MKNLLCFLISINLLICPAFALVVDELVENNLDKSLKIRTAVPPTVRDELSANTLDKNLKIAPSAGNIGHITDKLAMNLTATKPLEYRIHYINDDFLPQASNEVKKTQRKVDYSKNTVPVVIKIIEPLTTKSMPEEGSYVNFETVSDVTIKNVTYPKGTKVRGRVETVSMNFSSGVPADIVLGNFVINNVALQGEIKKMGANRSLWVKPCCAGGMFFFGAGLLFLLIRGGHAKILPSETFTVYL